MSTLKGSRSSGSSPRTRGTLRDRMRSLGGPRFIPAHAGNANRGDDGTGSHSVHPRARGERLRVDSSIPVNYGSSPRTRGTRQPRRDTAARKRFIPAHAGNAGNVVAANARRAVHPRARGEREEARDKFCPQTGSSPRTRGTQKLSEKLAEYRRFIPAHAGNAASRKPRRFRASVHPRARGERSLCRALIHRHIHHVNRSTDDFRASQDIADRPSPGRSVPPPARTARA